MKKLALDIDVFFACLGKDQRILRTVRHYDRVFISDIVWAQIEFILANAFSDGTDQKTARVGVYSFESFRQGMFWCDHDWHLPFNEAVARQFAILKHKFNARPHDFSDTELMIAASALEYECDLATFKPAYAQIEWLTTIIPV